MIYERRYSENAAPASILGQPFHNPYTFIPFGISPRRSKPTPLTQDETDPTRFTGIIRIDLRTLSPLFSPAASPSRDQNQTAVPALKAGGYPIVPASSIRGTIRSLLTILTGGTLGYVDESIYLTQGRDVQLGPRGAKSASGTPQNSFLAEIVEPGTPLRPGTVRVARADLLSEKELGKLLPQGFDLKKSRTRVSHKVVLSDGRFAKLAGDIKTRGEKKDGVFDPRDAVEITLSPKHWNAFSGRNRHSVTEGKLEKGDLVWIEPKRPEETKITNEEQVESIQWARWGRKGKHLLELLKKEHAKVFPDSRRDDGLVDEIVNLFGQIADREHPNAPSFAGRIRPDNLVFPSSTKMTTVQLSPLLTPHPGCIAFYRYNDDPDLISHNDRLRGYKVYRNTKERGALAPWLYDNAPVFNGDSSDPKSKLKFSRLAELIPEGSTASLQLSVRSLSHRELALILLACSVDWKLGGGKPLGLGHARPTRVRIIDEFGAERLDWNSDSLELDRANPAELPENFRAAVSDLIPRAHLYQATQRPVDRLRYPRAVSRNNNGVQRGGHAWFQRHATPKKSKGGLQSCKLGGKLKEASKQNEVLPQSLPLFSEANPFGDLLYGYDLANDTGDVTTQLNSDEPVALSGMQSPQTHPAAKHDKPRAGSRRAGS